MKVHISVDYEGCAGIFKWDEKDDDDFSGHVAESRRLMTGEVNAAILGVLDSAPDAEIVVADSHGGARNLLPEALHQRAELICGWPRILGMVEGLDSTFDMMFLVGYHARAGAVGGALDHTFSGSAVQEVRACGKPVGETEINAAVGGHFGVPLALVSGDDVLASDLRKTLDPAVRIVEVKKGISRYASRSLHPEEARRRIRRAASEAASSPRKPSPFVLGGDCGLEVELKSTAMAYAAEPFPGLERVKDRTFRFSPAPDYMTLFKRLMVFFDLSGTWR